MKDVLNFSSSNRETKCISLLYNHLIEHVQVSQYEGFVKRMDDRREFRKFETYAKNRNDYNAKYYGQIK